MSNRRIVIDDADAHILYSGPGQWFTAPGNDAVGTQGPTYLGAQHGLNGSASFSFTFEGTSIELYGTNGQVPSDSGTFDPDWLCFLDGRTFSHGAPSSDAQNNWSLCATTGLEAGKHNLEVQVTGKGNGTFWFDRLMYTPSGGSAGNSNTEVVWVSSGDPAFVYDNRWSNAGDANITSKPDATVSFSFTGKQVTWIGNIAGDFPGTQAPCTYAIDGGAPVSFQLPGHTPDDTRFKENQVIFSTPELSSGAHTINVTYHGQSNTPLTIRYVYVANATLPFLPATAISSAATSTASSQPTASTKQAAHHVFAGAIAGGVIGGLLLLALFGLSILLYRRRRNRTHLSKTPSPFLGTARQLQPPQGPEPKRHPPDASRGPHNDTSIGAQVSTAGMSRGVDAVGPYSSRMTEIGGGVSKAFTVPGDVQTPPPYTAR